MNKIFHKFNSDVDPINRALNPFVSGFRAGAYQICIQLPDGTNHERHFVLNPHEQSDTPYKVLGDWIRSSLTIKGYSSEATIHYRRIR